MTDTVTIDGLDGVLDAMSKLESKVQRKAIGSALRAGAKPIQSAARRNAAGIDDPATKENIGKQITTRTLTKKQLRALRADAGVGVGVLQTHGSYHYAWFVEEGTAHMQAKPFMRPAGESENEAAMQAIAASLQQSIFRS